jgi:hypothetical protein
MDPRKRQKKLERRMAKQKAERRELVRRESQGLHLRMNQASAAPILHCCAMDAIFHSGIGSVLVSRQLPNGSVAFVVFLVDMYCLGVKDVIVNIFPRPRYERDVYGKMIRQGGFLPLKPECARKLVEGAVQYALDLGLPPHADYRTGKLIFGDIEAEACPEQYTYGKDGMPLFIPGPYDDPARCTTILSGIENHRRRLEG